MNPFIWNWGSWTDRTRDLFAFSQEHNLPLPTRALLGGLLLRLHRITLETGLSLQQPTLGYRTEPTADRQSLAGPYWYWAWPGGTVELSVMEVEFCHTTHLVKTGWGRVSSPTDTAISQALELLAKHLEEARCP